MQLGVGSYTYVWGVGVPGYPQPERTLRPDDLLNKAVELGVKLVQIADNLPLHALGDTAVDSFARRAKAAGITLELGTLGTDPENLRAYVGLARRLDSRILRTVIDTPQERPSVDEVVNRLTPLVPVFEQAGVILAIENHDRFPATVLRQLVERIGSPNIGICLDTANSLGCMEGPAHVVEVLGALTVNLHIKDVRVYRPPHHKGFVVEGCAAGSGQLDIPWILRRLRDLGRDCNAIVELWPAPEARIEDAVAKEDAWTRDSVAYLRTLIPD